MVTPMRNPEYVYKIASHEAYRVFSKTGTFPGMPIDNKDGYVHFSTATQLAETLRLHLAGQSDLVIFAVRTQDLGMALRWEPSRGGALFPHLYAPLPIGAVRWVKPLPLAADGRHEFPPLED